MTLVQANNAATIVSVGVGPMLVPSRSLGSSTTVLVRQFPSRMGRAVTMNTLRTGGLLSHNNHDFLPCISIVGGAMDIWILSPVPKLPDRSVEDRFAFDANHRECRCPILALGTARQNRPRSATSRSTDGSRPWPTAPNTTTSNGVMQHIAARTAPIAPVVMRVRSRMAGSTPGGEKIPASVVAKVPDRDLIIGQDDGHFYASVPFLAQFERRLSPQACTQQSLGHC